MHNTHTYSIRHIQYNTHNAFRYYKSTLTTPSSHNSSSSTLPTHAYKENNKNISTKVVKAVHRDDTKRGIFSSIVLAVSAFSFLC